MSETSPAVAELDDDLQRPDRRQFLATLSAAGFALAVQPVHAAILTPATGLETNQLSLPTPSGKLPLYYARPAARGNAPLPVVLVVQEIFGVHEHIKDVCRRFAKLGYFALAPELYFRQGDPSRIESIPELLKQIVSKVPDTQVLDDLDRSLAWAGGMGGDTRRAGITGFCWGGRITWLYAAHNPQLKAAVAWYGKLSGPESALTPRHPLDIAAGLTVPVLGLYGGQDQSIPLQDVEAMRQALAKGPSGSEIVVYPDAGHAFHADYRPSYRAADAADGWARLQAWFGEHGLAPAA